jgi:hypothetical protein
MTWEEAGLISKYPEVNEALRREASRNVQAPELQKLKKGLEEDLETYGVAYSYGKVITNKGEKL